ncbi:MAG: hypothetical protein P3W84_000300 [Thermodesulfobacteriaceae bacterium]|nr:hypothetical protein [Thermodesulfobacteriaceae bacterium]
MKSIVALLDGVTIIFGVAGLGISSEKKDEKKDNATANETKKPKKKVEGC